MEGCHPAKRPMEERLPEPRQHCSGSRLHPVPVTSRKPPVPPPHTTRSRLCGWICESFHGEAD
jgi:hypothetical protein